MVFGRDRASNARSGMQIKARRKVGFKNTARLQNGAVQVSEVGSRLTVINRFLLFLLIGD